MNSAAELVSAFAGKRVLVLGDVMLDEYLWGEVHRISPEAPVPVVRLGGSTLAPGGAGNVAVNVRALGGEPLLHGLSSHDAAGAQLRNSLEGLAIATATLLEEPGRPTTAKTRIRAQTQQIVRVDREDDRPLEPATESRLLMALLDDIERCEALIVSDYAKGVVTSRVLKEALAAAEARGLPSVIDPAFGDVARYQPVTTLKLNHHEAVAACGWTGRRVRHNDVDSAGEMGSLLVQRLQAASVVITCGPEGLVLVERDARPLSLAAPGREVYDVTGAGDTVTATLALALAAGAELQQAASLSNLAGSLVVSKLGTAAVSHRELLAAAG